nr:MAG TPA: DNA pilot protein VP2 [Microviridae sp.]
MAGISDYLIPGAGAVLDFGFGVASSAISNNMSKKLMRYQNTLNIRNWQMQNEYNLPKNQMQRYLDAGLNPNLVYGNLQNSADSLSSPSSSSAPVQRRDSIVQTMAAAAQIEQMKAETRLIKAKTFREFNEAALTNERYNDARWRNSDVYRDNALKLLTGNALYMNYKADTEFSNSIHADQLNEAAIALRWSQRDLNVDEHMLNGLRANILQLTGNEILSRIALNSSLILTEQFKRENYASSTELNHKMVEKVGKEIALYGQQVINAIKSGHKIDSETINQNIKNILLRTFGTEQLSGQINGTAGVLTGAISKLAGNVDIIGYNLDDDSPYKPKETPKPKK